MKRAINSASVRFVLAKVPRLFPKASVCAGGNCRPFRITEKAVAHTSIRGSLLHADSQLRYAELSGEAMGIGSGIVEVANKVLVAQRMKHSGMRWRIRSRAGRPVVPRTAEIGSVRPDIVRPDGRERRRK